ncbi:hypothetical protein K9848_08600 [Latilactobacillus sakei]|uniref:hypothetical protein n=1 Tax=Latilactobacillus sakei TaxID=1599 RepID=UPI0020C7676E|nr:hypothetical protein [Latilactobacillus sakei]MCP8856252.1 hypothetical protein [Latilactobacillus sakei]
MNLKKRLNYVTTLLSPSFINFYLKNKQTPVADALTYVKLKKEARAFLDQYQVQPTNSEKITSFGFVGSKALKMHHH